LDRLQVGTIRELWVEKKKDWTKVAGGCQHTTLKKERGNWGECWEEYNVKVIQKEKPEPFNRAGWKYSKGFNRYLDFGG